eukprot:14660901-Ditylum_brightwellii.AAC.1
MAKVNWRNLMEEHKEHLKDLVIAGMVDIIRTNEVERYKESSAIESIHDLTDIIEDAETILVH